MNADFEVVAVTQLRDGTKRLELQPIGEPTFRLIELREPEEEGTLGALVIEIDEDKRYVPRPGETVRLKVTKPRAE